MIFAFHDIEVHKVWYKLCLSFKIKKEMNISEQWTIFEYVAQQVTPERD